MLKKLNMTSMFIFPNTVHSKYFSNLNSLTYCYLAYNSPQTYKQVLFFASWNSFSFRSDTPLKVVTSFYPLYFLG